MAQQNQTGLDPAQSKELAEKLKVDTVKEAVNISNGMEAIRYIVEVFQTLLSVEREIHSIGWEIGDEGTSALMSDYIRQQEKEVWMYSAYLK